MKYLNNFLGALELTGIVLTGCNSDYEIVHRNKGTRQEYVRKVETHNGLYSQVDRRDNYIHFALKLKKENPKKLRDINTANLVAYLHELNPDKKELKEGDKIILPVY